jgi:hypothetical protein
MPVIGFLAPLRWRRTCRRPVICQLCSRPNSNWSSTFKTAKALDLTVPLILQMTADELIE